jgi:hypothetical protein
MVSARITERSRNTSRPLDTYAETHSSEESDTPNKGVPSKTQVRRSGTGSSEVIVQSSIVVHFLVVGGRIGLDEVNTVVGTGHSILVGREKVFAAKSAPCNRGSRVIEVTAHVGGSHGRHSVLGLRLLLHC